MKKYLSLAVLLFSAAATQAQGYLGIGTGTCRNTWIVNLQGGYQAKHFVLELEMKTPTASEKANQPLVVATKAGYPVNFKNGLLLVPYLQYSYQYYSADVSKTAEWQNGYQAGMGVRLQYGHIFVQADHFKNNYFSIGISKTLPHR